MTALLVILAFFVGVVVTAALALVVLANDERAHTRQRRTEGSWWAPMGAQQSHVRRIMR